MFNHDEPKYFDRFFKPVEIGTWVVYANSGGIRDGEVTHFTRRSVAARTKSGEMFYMNFSDHQYSPTPWGGWGHYELKKRPHFHNVVVVESPADAR